MEFAFYSSPSLEGGGAYLRHLQTALAGLGHTLSPAGSPGALRVIDGRVLPEIDPPLLEGAVCVVHHPAALAGEAARAAERTRLKLLRRVIATSEPVRAQLQDEYGVAASVVHPGVPDAPRSAGSGGPDCTVLSLGALVPRKGHATLIRALQRLSDLPWRLVIVGDPARDPAHAAELRALADPARVHFAGVLDDAALAAQWARADLFALATAWEGWPAGAAEALRRGLPVATTTGGAAGTLVPPEAGILVEPGEADQLSKALRRLIFDTELRAAMAEAAWRRGQALPDWPAQAQRFVEAACSSAA